jgi:hypothetical protein
VAREQPGEPVLAGFARKLGAVRGVPVDPPSGQRRHAEDLPATPGLADGELAVPIVDDGAVGDNPACTRWTVAEQRGSGRRVDPVGADDDLRLEPLSADQPDRTLSADFSRLGAEADDAVSGRRQQCPLQLGAVNERERRAIAPLQDLRRDRRDQLPVTGSPDPTVAPRNLGGVGGGPGADLAKGAGAVGSQREPGAERREPFGALEHRHLVAVPAQNRCRGQAADPSADDHDPYRSPSCADLLLLHL